MKQLTPFYVYTPLGLAEVYGIWDNGDDPEWVTFICSTGECWTWKNEFIRRAPSVTNMRTGVSPFGEVNHETRQQIARYKDMGYLPRNYDRADTSTWT